MSWIASIETSMFTSLKIGIDRSSYPLFLFDFMVHFKMVDYCNIGIAYCFIFREEARKIQNEIKSRIEESSNSPVLDNIPACVKK
jgi:uncharacterized metal-binding protein